MTDNWAKEKWEVSEDGRTATVTGRERYPHSRWDVAWWIKNDEEPEPPSGYLPELKQEDRIIRWYIRNPLQNFGKYVLGVYDRNYTVTGTAPVRLTAWNDLPGWDEPGFPHRGLLRGWKWSVIWLGWMPLPFVSYTGRYVMWYALWQYWGFFGFKWNVLHSDVQVV